MSKGRISITFFMVLAWIAALSACASLNFESRRQMRIGVIASSPFRAYMASIGAEDIARELNGTYIQGAKKKEYGNRFLIEVVIEDKPDYSHFQSAARRFSLIVTSESKYIPMILRTYRDYPSVHFMSLQHIVPGVVMENNVSSYTIDASQGAFLAGMAAAATGAGKIAFLGSVNEAWMVNNALNFVAGAIFIDPEFKDPFKYEYDFVGKATDEVTARAKTSALFGNGADLVFANTQGSNAGVYDSVKQYSKLLIGTLEHDFLRFDLDTQRIRDKTLLGDNLVTVLERRMDRVLFNALKNFIEKGPARGNVQSSGGLASGVWSLMQFESNTGLVEKVMDEATAFARIEAQGLVQLPKQFASIGRYVEQVTAYRRSNPYSPVSVRSE